jgi:predicted RND superfamily exporter protein
MMMDGASKGITAHPGLAVFSVVIITLLLLSGVYFNGINSTFDEESFLPDVDIAKADVEISESFSREFSIPILVKSNNANVITPASMVEILQVEKAVTEDEFLVEVMEDPEVPSRNFNSVADQIIFIYVMSQSLDGFNVLKSNLDLLNDSFNSINQNIEALISQVKSVDTSDNETTIETFENVSFALNGILQQLPDPMQALANMSGGGGDNGTGGGPPGSMNLDYDQQIGIFSAMSEQELIELITTALTYDGSTTSALRNVYNWFLTNSELSMGKISDLMTELGTLSDDQNLINTTLYNNTYGENTTALDNLNSLLNSSGAAAGLFGGYSMGFAAIDLNNATMQIDSIFGFMGSGLSYMLTKDFQPESGSYKAKGTLILVYFNATMIEAGGSSDMHSGGGGDIAIEIEETLDYIATKQFDWEETEFTVIGNNLIMNTIMDANNESLVILLVISIIFVIILLSIIYRSLFDMGLSLLALLFGIAWMYGVGAFLGFTFNPITTMVPVLIVGLGIDYGIHLTLRYREERCEGRTINRSIGIAIASVGTALLLATVTTVVAFLSNLSSPISLLAEFGILSAVGIVGCFVAMTVFLPALKLLRDERLKRKGTLHKKEPRALSRGRTNNNNSGVVNLFDKGVASGAVAASKYPLVVVAITILITGSALYGAVNLETKFEFEDFLPEGLDITEDLDFMMNEFSATSVVGEETVMVLIKGDIEDPSVLTSIDRTVTNMGDDTYVNRMEASMVNGNNNNNNNKSSTQILPDVESVLSVMKDYAWGTSANESFSVLYYKVFDMEDHVKSNATRSAVQNIYIWLCTYATKETKFILHQDLDTGKFDATVLRISVNVENDEKKSFDTLDELNDDIAPLEDNSNIDSAIVTGGPILFNTIMTILNESQMRSLLITIIACTIILTIVFYLEKRSLTLGIITALPVVLVISWTMGVMFLLDIPLNIMTITIASLTVGLGVTYGIHITHRFLESIEVKKTIDEACHSTLKHTGTALLGAAATTIAAFGLLSFALLPPIQQFGFISAITIFFSLMACLFILPTFLVLWARFRLKRGTLKDESKAKTYEKIIGDGEEKNC